jgi:hypothetical protein
MNTAYKEKLQKAGDHVITFIAVFIIGIIVHALVLKFIFPGYYDPFIPNHEDFYIPLAFVHAPIGFDTLMNWTRPVFMMFYKATGYAGIQGGTAIIVAVVIANCALTASLIKRALNLAFGKEFTLTFIIYCVLLFAMPYFYIFYTEDPGSHLSYLFLMCAAHAVLFVSKRHLWLSLFLASVFSILAYLSKETYQLVALFFSGLWFLYYRKESIKRSLVPGIATVIGIVMSLLNNLRLNSVFVNPDAEQGNPYKMDLSPFSVLREMWRYFREGMNPADILLVLGVAWLVYSYFRKKGKKSNALLLLTIGCLAAPFLAWVPNALLPNHHYGGYSFNGLYLFYLPLFLLPFLRLHKSVSTVMLILLVLLIPASHIFNRKTYKDSTHRAVLFYEDTQRNLLFALDSFIAAIQPNQEQERVLVKGITFSFSPFVYPESLREFANAKYATYDVVSYNGRFRFEGRKDLVRFINESDTTFSQYTRVWTFNENGKLKSAGQYENIIDDTRKPGDSSAALISLENLKAYSNSGIYPPEGEIAWTNGDVSIELNVPIRSIDTLTARLSTYLPEKCKDIIPKLLLVDTDGVEHAATATKKKANIFYYTFKAPGKSIQKIRIISPALPPVPEDKRVLSFPFIELYIR